ncbi:MAG: GNAT family N-acetyltransferase [Lachnospiraceae bacterium]|jgi:GNAT superfamily N-acetyltransferase|nr:GNAT family N-acetyltransferase [Lachnospiraceae bacterium]MCH4032032.1 GNAT family N-acetyltransferase [Lachnospiraceae bacterium]MCH4070649.1 GNAT family N-acetyltransferase [Lachnospiraceae bacterium]MCH4109323.1 GNAT family N-acetyltransferase [Lachnospiraceae bacterium]MCI1303211.1 GNAT family N-acetyltransferase [Lachnospiraceae bacterium]
MQKIIHAQEDMGIFISLVKEYTDQILREDADVAKTLASQNLEAELNDAGKKYGFPDGRMYILLVDGNAAGCAALSRLGGDCCEIKRLYIRPEYRGRHLSRMLCDKVIQDAKEIGYKRMRLDTFPFMKSAIRLYESYGFHYIEKYNDNPAKNAVFMELNLPDTDAKERGDI